MGVFEGSIVLFVVFSEDLPKKFFQLVGAIMTCEFSNIYVKSSFLPPCILHVLMANQESPSIFFAICLNPHQKIPAPAALLQGLLAPVRKAARVQAATCLSQLAQKHAKGRFAGGPLESFWAPSKVRKIR